jgi:hypothetical protein
VADFGVLAVQHFGLSERSVDVLAPRQKRGWQDLSCLKGPEPMMVAFFTIQWFLPGFDVDGQPESDILPRRGGQWGF